MDEQQITPLEAFTQKLAVLNECRREFAGREGETDRLWRDHLWAHQSVKLVIDLLDSDPEWRAAGLRDPFERILLALNATAEGRTPPLFKPEKRHGRRRVALEADVLRGEASAVMQYLMDMGADREGAAKFVLRGLGRTAAGWLGETKAATWETVARWRDDISAARGSTPGRQTFDHRRPHIAEYVRRSTQQTYENEATQMLRRLRLRIAEVGGPPIRG